jgi:hypothetical protein
MILRKKGNDLFVFENEQELKDYCSNSKQVSLGEFKSVTLQKFNKRTNRFDRTSSDKL